MTSSRTAVDDNRPIIYHFAGCHISQLSPSLPSSSLGKFRPSPTSGQGTRSRAADTLNLQSIPDPHPISLPEYSKHSQLVTSYGHHHIHRTCFLFRVQLGHIVSVSSYFYTVRMS